MDVWGKRMSEKQKQLIGVLSGLLVVEVVVVVGLLVSHFNPAFFSEQLGFKEILVNGSTAFFGYFFSFLAAVLTFQFLKYRENQKEVARATRLYRKLKKEYRNNYGVLVDLAKEITNSSTELAKLLIENQKIRELFILAVYRLEFVMYASYYHETDWQLIRAKEKHSESYLELFEQSHQIAYLCQGIVENKFNTEAGLRQLLQLITQKTEHLQQRHKGLALEQQTGLADSETAFETKSVEAELVQ